MVLKIGNAGGWDSFENTTSFQNSHLINSIKCDITIDEIILDTGNNPRSFVLIEGFFLNTQISGGPTGDVWAGLYIGDRGSGTEAFWEIIEFLDDNLTSWASIGSGSLGLLGPAPFYTATLAYNNVTDQFTIDVGGTGVSVPVVDQRPAQTPFKGITARIDADNGSGSGFVSIEVDNVFTNNAVFDTFDSPPLDRTNWQELEVVREIASGKARLNVQADGERSDITLNPGNQATDYLEAKVLIENESHVSPGARGMTRIAGWYYNDSRGPGSGLPYNGNQGDVWVNNLISLGDNHNLSASCSIIRIDTDDSWGPGTTLFNQDFQIPIEFDTEYTLSIELSDSKIIFKCNNESYEYDISTPMYPPADGRHRQLRSRVTADPGETGYMKVRFDDVFVSPDDYMIYSTFNPDGIEDVVQVGGYVEDYGIPTTWGDEIQYLYFLSGTIGYKVRVWITDSDDPSDPTPYIEPRQHPDHPRFPGPIEPRHYDIISSGDLVPYIAGSGSHTEEFHVDSTGVYLGAFPNGIHKFDHDWNYVGMIANPPPERTESLAYDAVNKTWYAGGRLRTIYQLNDTNGDGDLLDEMWQDIFTYPSYAGGHNDGMEYVAGYLWISDMTSDIIGQWGFNSVSSLWEELDYYTYTNPAAVEGMGFGPNNHFWCGSGWGPNSFLYELGNDITTKYPVAVAGEDVPDHPPLINIEFDASGSYHQNPEQNIVLYEWDFNGDGVYDYSGINPVTTHAYPAVYLSDGVTIDWDATSNDYVAILRVTDDTLPIDGGPLTHTDARIIHITAPPWKPIADPDGPYNTRINQTVELDGSGSYDPESQMYPSDHPWYETIASYEWDLNNDGEFDDASGQKVLWQWANEGTYFICLRVTDTEPSGPGGTFGNLDIDTKCTVVLVSSIHDVTVESINLSSNKVLIGDNVMIDAMLSNHGDYTEDVDVACYYDSQLIDITNVSELNPSDSENLRFNLDTTGMVEGTYTIKACADAVPGEIIVANNCSEATIELRHIIPVYVDLRPGSCPNPVNIKNKGVLPVAILGSDEFDVDTIDPNTIMLSREGVDGVKVSSVNWSYEDVATPYQGDLCGCHDLNGDGYKDMTLKFSTKELVDNLNLKDVMGQTISLTITGDLTEAEGAVPIEGQDCVWVVK